MIYDIINETDVKYHEKAETYMISLIFDHPAQVSDLLLQKDTFDGYIVGNILMTAKLSFVLENTEENAKVPYKEIRPLVSSFASTADGSDPDHPFLMSLQKARITLHAPQSYQNSLLAGADDQSTSDLIRSLVLTFRWENDTLTALTGISYSAFTTDKSAERLWDQAIQKAFDHLGISYTL